MQSERLYQDAARLSVQAEKLPDGAEREELVRLARQAEQRTSGFLQRPRGLRNKPEASCTDDNSK